MAFSPFSSLLGAIASPDLLLSMMRQHYTPDAADDFAAWLHRERPQDLLFVRDRLAELMSAIDSVHTSAASESPHDP